jgi:hypothetical protein
VAVPKLQHPIPPIAVEDHCPHAGHLPEPGLRATETAAHRMCQLRPVRRQADSGSLIAALVNLAHRLG